MQLLPFSSYCDDSVDAKDSPRFLEINQQIVANAPTEDHPYIPAHLQEQLPCQYCLQHLNEQDVELVVEHARVSRATAILLLQVNQNDPVDAILNVDDYSNFNHLAEQALTCCQDACPLKTEWLALSLTKAAH